MGTWSGIFFNLANLATLGKGPFADIRPKLDSYIRKEREEGRGQFSTDARLWKKEEENGEGRTASIPK